MFILRRVANWLLGLWIVVAALWAVIWKLFGDRNGNLYLVNSFALWILGSAWLASWLRTLLGGHWWSLPLGEGLGVLFLRHYAWMFSRREPASDRSDSSSRELRVVTANLLKKSKDLSSTAEAFERHQVDVAVLQEVTSDAFDSLREPLKDSHPWCYWISHPTARLGLGVMSRWPLAVEQRWNVGITGPYCLRLRLLVAGEPLLIYNMHFVSPLYDHPRMSADRSLAIRAHQMDTVLQDALAQDSPVLLMGDWNTTEGSDIHRRARASFVDVWAEYGQGPGWTWPHNLEPHISWPFRPCLRLDHAFCSRGLDPGQPQVLDIEAESDHSPLLVPLHWPPASEPAEVGESEEQSL